MRGGGEGKRQSVMNLISSGIQAGKKKKKRKAVAVAGFFVAVALGRGIKRRRSGSYCYTKRKGDFSFFHTLAMRVRRNERTRYLNLSNSVWMMMRRKLAFGSGLPVSPSMSSICCGWACQRLLFGQEEAGSVGALPACVFALAHVQREQMAMAGFQVHSARSPMCG